MAADKPTVLIINGPNLNLLGTREPEIYGTETLDDICAAVTSKADALGIAVDFRQSNSEGEIVDWIHEAREAHAGILINAGAYSHTSVAIMDALLAYEGAIVEVHLSNLFKREQFRHHSYITSVAQGLICGLGSQGYDLALQALAPIIKNQER